LPPIGYRQILLIKNYNFSKILLTFFFTGCIILDSGIARPTNILQGGYIMEHVTAKKRGFSPALMARVDACAYIFMADKPEKIAAIMENREVSELEAGRIYTIGALKAAKRRGTAKNYREAIEALEAEQAGDRGNPLTRTMSADRTDGIIQYINHLNRASPMRVNKVDAVRMAWAHMDHQPLTAYAQPQNWHTEEKRPEETKRAHTLNTGKVLGTLYTEWEARELEADPANEARHGIIEKNLNVFFAEYISRLSRTVKMRLAELVESINRPTGGDMLKADRVIKYLTSAQGRAAPETSKLANFAVNLHRNFDHKDSVSCPEFISLLCRYGDIG
jgi:hypothetical protein